MKPIVRNLQDLGYVRVAVAAPEHRVADVDFNLQKMQECDRVELIVKLYWKEDKMAADRNDQYIRLKAGDGQELICPIHTQFKPSSVSEEFIDDCVERDVLERYAGNIEIVDK